ncbi:hypothetical protein GUITHDRAFT_99284 [Guillardia theta CCMP2712]|uniref:Uncharacterized protein n=1 Tax=Guillardia theta (strain CCMP2712) TaxID=905079 RepID=L1K4H7_GUITC|nr:hypothetical protein GUITHDRAFT_99284 [Guillardia theta CCMP2712]EKX55509.1 hypothetical protein GUITHDRAFT_99284 [Guillardia theta CCMP2712]|eukprot:XP_005842489.1 hypothetical protein GUITHDRAFT_99284 [Guillardia theta CCMP2712]
MILSAGDPNKPHPQTKFRTSLHLAVISNDISCVELLVKAGAEIESRADYGRTPLHFACWPWKSEDIGRDVPFGSFELKFEMSKCLVRLGANVNARDNDGVSILHTAAGAGFVKLCGLLLESGARLEAVDVDGNTPLMAAAQQGRDEACGFLLAAGAKIGNLDERKVSSRLIEFGILVRSKISCKRIPMLWESLSDLREERQATFFHRFTLSLAVVG